MLSASPLQRVPRPSCRPPTDGAGSFGGGQASRPRDPLGRQRLASDPTQPRRQGIIRLKAALQAHDSARTDQGGGAPSCGTAGCFPGRGGAHRPGAPASYPRGLHGILPFTISRTALSYPPGTLHHVMGWGLLRQLMFRHDHYRDEFLPRLGTHSDHGRRGRGDSARCSAPSRSAGLRSKVPDEVRKGIQTGTTTHPQRRTIGVSRVNAYVRSMFSPFSNGREETLKRDYACGTRPEPGRHPPGAIHPPQGGAALTAPCAGFAYGWKTTSTQ